MSNISTQRSGRKPKLKSRAAKIALGIPLFIATTFYLPILWDMTDQYGWLFMLPMFAMLLAGALCLTMLLDEFFQRPAFASSEVIDSYLPAPSIRAFDWDERLMASTQSVAEALANARDGHLKGFSAIAEDRSELTATLQKTGWTARTFSADGSERSIAVPLNSAWSGREVPLDQWEKVDESSNEGVLDHSTMIALVSHFFGWEDAPDTIAWARLTSKDALKQRKR